MRLINFVAAIKVNQGFKRSKNEIEIDHLVIDEKHACTLMIFRVDEMLRFGSLSDCSKSSHKTKQSKNLTKPDVKRVQEKFGG